MQPSIDELSVFRTAHPNTLLIGPEATANAVISQQQHYFRAPVVDWHPRDAAKPPTETGTLVIRDVDTLDLTQQEQFFGWLDRYAAGVQVISVTGRPLFPLIEAGAFLEKLYYRLNIICLSLSSQTHARGVHPAKPYVAAPSSTTRGWRCESVA